MVQLSNKAFLAVILIFAVILVISVLIAVDFMGWGTALSGVGGPIAAGLYNILATLPRWVLSGGWPTMIAGVAILIIIVFGAGYIFEQKQIYGAITGAKAATNPINSGPIQREPEEPETNRSPPK